MEEWSRSSRTGKDHRVEKILKDGSAVFACGRLVTRLFGFKKAKPRPGRGCAKCESRSQSL